MDNKASVLLVALGASLWGVIGIFVSQLYEIGFTPIQVVAIRVAAASFFMVIYVLGKNRALFKIKLRDSWYFVGTGIVSIVLFNFCLFSAMEEASISIAFILLYTAPAFVTLFSWLLFRETLTLSKVSALGITLIGCSFVIGLLPNVNASISIMGLILGLCSGLFYALYSIFGKAALQHYDSLTVIVYTFLFASIAIIPFSGLTSKSYLFTSFPVWALIIGLGFVSTMLPFILYTTGLQYVESSRASIIATIEPVVASLIGFLFFNETLTIWQYVGMVLVISSVILVQETKKKNKHQQPYGEVQV